VGEISAERATRRRGVRWLSVASLPLVSLALTGCSQQTVNSLKRLGLPPATSDRAVYIHHLWIGAWIAAGCVGVLVWGLILWAALHYRRRSDDDFPVQTRYNLPIEVLYTIAPIIVIAVLFFFTVETQNKVLADVKHPDHTVQVVGQQWSWTFDYLHEKSIGGRSVFDVGTPAQFPTLWLVKGQTVDFELRSPDVIHSFWVPSFAMKLDVIPGRDNAFSLRPTRLGEFAGRCAELCGWLHSRMLFNVKVVNQGAFEAHLHHLQAIGQTGAPVGGEQSITVSGLAQAGTGQEHGGGQ
jgi:cytochrome c oxidase subunit 2